MRVCFYVRRFLLFYQQSIFNNENENDENEYLYVNVIVCIPQGWAAGSSGPEETDLPVDEQISISHRCGSGIPR